MADESKTKNETTLTSSLAKVGELSSKVEQLQKDLDAANARADAAEKSLSAEQAAHANTKNECEALKSEKRDFDESVNRKAAAIAAQSGVENPPPANTQGEVATADLNELNAKIEKTSGVEKYQIIEKNYDAILAAVRKANR